MTKIILKALFSAAISSGISVTFTTCADEGSSSASCDFKTHCLNEAVLCLSGKGLVNHSQGNAHELSLFYRREMEQLPPGQVSKALSKAMRADWLEKSTPKDLV
ncbi:uncharacterized protein LOC111327363 [Stylophora pistillata]|uniref:uncharacterized protein LOC111327363 n=1 Tax=Stylophora pistillata TaxID=50429 RepID=UPI000C04E1A7|nr:uncharacterized protein LOC111327363 [Stylophora pistillata]